MPDGIYNRRADNWRPLLAVAGVAGGNWPERARKAVEQSNETGGDMSRIALLLADIRKIFKELNTDKIFSLGLVEALRAIEGRPWAEYHDDKPISQNQLATALKPVGIAPEIIRINEDRARGYRREQFNEAFERYRPSEGIPDRDTVTKPDEMGTSDIFQGVTPESDVTVPKSRKSNNDGLCHGVTVQKGGMALLATTPAFVPSATGHQTARRHNTALASGCIPSARDFISPPSATIPHEIQKQCRTVGICSTNPKGSLKGVEGFADYRRYARERG